MVVVNNWSLAANGVQVITCDWNWVLELDNLCSWQREIELHFGQSSKPFWIEVMVPGTKLGQYWDAATSIFLHVCACTCPLTPIFVDFVWFCSTAIYGSAFTAEANHNERLIMDYSANEKLPYWSKISDTVKLVLLLLLWSDRGGCRPCSEHFTHGTNAQMAESFGRASRCHENELMIKWDLSL